MTPLLDHAFTFELGDVGSAAIEVERQCRRSDGRGPSRSRPRGDERTIIGDGLKQDFIYFAGGRRLSLSGWGATAISLYGRGRWQADKTLLDHACQNCSRKSQCITGPERRIPRWEQEHLLEAAAAP